MTLTYRVGTGLYVNLTNRCPCACTFCIRQNGPGVYGSDPLWLEREPTADEICESIERNLGDSSELVFCGYGEPTRRHRPRSAGCRTCTRRGTCSSG